MVSSISEVCGFTVHTRTQGWSFFHPETRFQKSAFTGSMWTIGQNVFTQKRVSMWTAQQYLAQGHFDSV